MQGNRVNYFIVEKKYFLLDFSLNIYLKNLIFYLNFDLCKYLFKYKK